MDLLVVRESPKHGSGPTNAVTKTDRASQKIKFLHFVVNSKDAVRNVTALRAVWLSEKSVIFVFLSIMIFSAVRRANTSDWKTVVKFLGVLRPIHTEHKPIFRSILAKQYAQIK